MVRLVAAKREFAFPGLHLEAAPSVSVDDAQPVDTNGWRLGFGSKGRV